MVEKYTLDEIIKNLVLLQGHFQHFQETTTTEENLFCKDCIQKHLYAVEGLADEGVKFFPDRVNEFQELSNWAKEIREDIPNLSIEKVRNILTEIDTYRKQFAPEGTCYKCQLKNISLESENLHLED